MQGNLKPRRLGYQKIGSNRDEEQSLNSSQSCDVNCSTETLQHSSVNNINSIESKSAYIQAEIGNCSKFIKTKILIDTGADFDVIDFRFLTKLRNQGIKYHLLKPRRRPILAANNQPMKLFGECELDMKLTSTDCKTTSQAIRFQVLGNLSTPCILGINTIRKLGLFVKGDTIQLGDQKICLLTNGKSMINLIDSFTDENGAKWGLYTDSLDFQEENYQFSANNVESLREEYAEGTSIENEPSEMKAGKFLVQLDVSDDPPNQLAIDISDQTRWLNRLQHCKEKPKRTLITDEKIDDLVSKSQFSGEGRRKLTKVLKKFREVFSSSSFDVGKYKGEKAKLNFKDENVKPVFVPVRRIPHSLRDWLTKHLDEMEEKGIITKSKTSKWNSPLFLVPKKDKSWRPVSDFRALNKQLEDVYFPIPFITDLLDSLHGTKFFSSVDLRSGFYNIELDEESTHCTAFSALGRTYKYLRLPQGIKLSPLIFQQIMTELFHDDPACLVYMDDVLVASKSESEAIKDIERLLKRFMDHGFLLNPEKCIFGSKKLDYLGYEISQDGWTINKSKVTDLLNVKPPSSTTEVRSFTGLLNFYLNCIPNLQRILQPLHQLTGKKKFKWTDECQKAFELARQKLAEATTMSFPSMKQNDRYYLTTDASDNGWGVCLSQFQNDKGYEVPLSFGSGSFANAEVNWPIKEKEMFSFVKALKLYDTYLYGRQFTWRTDNRALSFFHSPSVLKSTALKSCSPKVARWIDFVNEFDYSIEHHQGSTDVMGGSDFLSRRAAQIAAIQDKKIDLKNIWLYSGVTLSEMIKQQSEDDDLKNFRNGYSQLKSKKLYKVSIENELMIATKVNHDEQLIIIPRKLIEDVLSFYHGVQHTGIVNMTKKISSRFYIPDATKEIKKFVQNCVECTRAKSAKKKLDEPTRQTSSKHPWMAVSADLIGPFPLSYNDNQYCLVVVDNLTRWTEIRSLKTKQAQSVADGFMKIFHVRGLPLSLLCDNGKEFFNFGLQKMFQKMGTNLQYTTPYRPQSNGITERCNQKIKQLLRLWNVNDATWDTYIDPIQFLINNEYNRMLGMSAFQAIHGWTLARMDFMKPEDIENLEITEFDSKQWAKQHSVKMTKMLGELYINDVETKTKRYEKLRRDYDKSFPDADKDFPNGAHVLIQFPQAPGTSKLVSNWKGTYVIINQVDKNVYRVSHSEGQRRKMLVHKSRIRLLPTDRDDSIKADCSVAVADKSKDLQESGQLRTKEHPTAVKEETRDHSVYNKKHFDLGDTPKEKAMDNQMVERNKKTKHAPNRHSMKLRSQK